MKSEHYTEDEIEKFFAAVNDKNEHLMNKYITRMKIAQDPVNKTLPIIWNRWKQFVAMRKLVKYQFNFCHNNIENQKADLQRSFNIMKRGPQKLENELSK